MHAVVDKARTNLEEALKSKENLTYFQERAEFIDDYVLQVGGKTITAKKIVIATGARSLVPPIPGLLETGFLDNVSLLRLQALPASLIITGAGYIGCEFGHFFSAMGTKVTIQGCGHGRRARPGQSGPGGGNGTHPGSNGCGFNGRGNGATGGLPHEHYLGHAARIFMRCIKDKSL